MVSIARNLKIESSSSPSVCHGTTATDSPSQQHDNDGADMTNSTEENGHEHGPPSDLTSEKSDTSTTKMHLDDKSLSEVSANGDHGTLAADDATSLKLQVIDSRGESFSLEVTTDMVIEKLKMLAVNKSLTLSNGGPLDSTVPSKTDMGSTSYRLVSVDKDKTLDDESTVQTVGLRDGDSLLILEQLYDTDSLDAAGSDAAESQVAVVAENSAPQSDTKPASEPGPNLELIAELENRFREETAIFTDQVTELTGRLVLAEKSLSISLDKYHKMRAHINEQYKRVAHEREEMTREVNRLRGENEVLLGRHLTKSTQLQSEIINLPQDATELQFLCLKLHEELITSTVSRERVEETLNSEIVFLKEEMRGEIASKEAFEETITQENDSLRAQLESVTIQFGQLRLRDQEQQAYIGALKEKLALMATQSQSQIDELQAKVNDQSAYTAQCEKDLSHLRHRTQTLQQELENCETVQKDFVKLSQSLQVQLEEIRQGDNSVRWEHEDDAIECRDCKKLFHSKKEKQRCQHCCKIFCPECNCKSVVGGPKGRTFKVCRVCHTLINKETAPYFSSNALRTPT